MECEDAYIRQRAVSVVGGDEYVCPFLFDFLTVDELGRAAAVCRTWKASAEDDELWRQMYERTQVGETGMEDWARALAARPFGEDAVGWEVEVLSEDNATWQQGLVLEFSAGRYRVEYADGTSRWETEYRTEGPWHRRGNSRLYFSGRLHDTLADQGVGGGDGPAIAGVATTLGNPPVPPSADFGAAPASATVMRSGEQRGAPASSSLAWPRLRYGRWREELKANSCHVPAVELARLADHTDEVLDLKFSPDGTRLATCSRDMSILVYAIEDMPRHDTEEEEEGESDDQDGGTHRKPRAAVDGSGIHSTVRTAGDQNEAGGASGGGSNSGGGGRSRFDGTHENREEMLHPLQYGRLGIRLIHRLRRSATASVCRIFWSPCSQFILSCLEEPHGNPFIPSSSELWDASSGQWLSRCRSQPFDVHAAWFPDGKHFVAGLNISWDETDETVPFSQILAIRRRPNIVSHRGGTAVPALSPTPMAEDRPGDGSNGGGGGGGGGGTTGAFCPHDGGKGNPTGETLGGSEAGWGLRAVPLGGTYSGPNDACAVDPAAACPAAESASEGVAWGEEALSLPSCVAASAASLSLLHLGAAAEQGDATMSDAADQFAGDDSNRRAGSSVAVPVAGAPGPENAAGAGARAAAAAAAAEATAARMAPHKASVETPGSVRHRALESTAQGILWVDPGLEGKGLPQEDTGSSGGDITAVVPGRQPLGELQLPVPASAPSSGVDSSGAAAAAIAATASSLLKPRPPSAMMQNRGDGPDGDADAMAPERGGGEGGYSFIAADRPLHTPVQNQESWSPAVAALDAAGGGGGCSGGGMAGSPPADGISGGGGLFGFGLNVAEIPGMGPAVGGGSGGSGGGGGVGGNGGGGVEWVMEGGEAIAEADEADMPLVAEIQLRLTSNFAHFFQMSTSGLWACMATGDTPLMCHRIAFVPLVVQSSPTPTPMSPQPAASSSKNPSASCADKATPLAAEVDADGCGGVGGEHDVFIRLARGGGSNGSGNGGDVDGDGDGDGHREQHVFATRMETVECGGAVLSLTVSRDDRFVMVNVRPFMKHTVENVQPIAGRNTEAPEISNEIEMQVWDVATKKILFKLGGHHAFTTKDCPFLILAAQSMADPFGDYMCSGSEEHRVFVWHLRHRLLLSVLKGHTDVVNSVSWNPKYPGLLASCGDDGKTIIWGPYVR